MLIGAAVITAGQTDFSIQDLSMESGDDSGEETTIGSTSSTEFV